VEAHKTRLGETEVKILLTGASGFLGGAINDKLDDLFSNYSVVDLEDLKHGQLYQKGATHLLHFAAPSSQILFNEDDSCIKDTITDFIRVVEFCKKKRIKLIFPSSATVYTEGNSYSFTKLALEDIAKAYGISHLVLRIGAGYGPGEEHKKDYSSVIYKWAKEMMRGESPLIYGDGTQTRDFVYVDDVVDVIMDSLEVDGLLDIATGINTPFNRIVQLLNLELSTNIEPVYVEKPKKYFKDTICPHPIKDFITIEQGVKKLCAELKS